MPRPVVRSFWHGPPLGYYHRACITSFLAKDIGFELYTYDSGLEVPAGATIRDAREILDGSVLAGRKGRSFAGQHSDLFRLEMLHRLGGWWVDTDIMLLGDSLPACDHFIARYGPPGLNHAAFALPAGSPIAAQAIVAFKARVSREPKPRWGELGPDLITRVIAELGQGHIVQPAEIAYPIHWLDLILMLDPKLRAEAAAKCAGATFLHLWDGWWRDCGIPFDFLPPEGSYLDGLLPADLPRHGTHRRMLVREVRAWCRNRNALDEAGRLRTLLHGRVDTAGGER